MSQDTQNINSCPYDIKEDAALQKMWNHQISRFKEQLDVDCLDMVFMICQIMKGMSEKTKMGDKVDANAQLRQCHEYLNKHAPINKPEEVKNNDLC